MASMLTMRENKSKCPLNSICNRSLIRITAIIVFFSALNTVFSSDFDIVKGMADKGDAEAQAKLGLIYYYGEGVLKNREKAIELWRLSADQDNATGQCRLGWSMIYTNQEGVITVRNDQNGVALITKAADAGLADAMYKLGFLNSEGVIDSSSLSGALKWFRKAADLGHVSAMKSSADILFGLHIQSEKYPELVNASEALLLYEKAANLGNVSAQYTLGRIYSDRYYSVIVKPTLSPSDAIKWLTMAAGSPSGEYDDFTIHRAQMTLAEIYSEGTLVPLNMPEAIRWYEISAVKGDGYAQAALGRIYSAGRGLPADLAEAYTWFSLAVSNGVKSALVPRAEIEEKMSVKDRIKAQLLIFRRRSMVKKK